MPILLRLLIVEDSESDADLVVRLFKKAGYQVSSQRVETRPAMQAALTPDTWDCIIADHNMPEFDAFDALDCLRSSGLDIPFVVVSGSIGEEAAVALMKAGAADYVMKGKMARLTAVVERELRDADTRRERRQAIEALRANEERFRRLYENAPLAYQSLNAEGNFVEVNRVWLDTLGYTRDEVIGHPFGDFITAAGLDTLAERFPRFQRDGEVHGVEYTMRRKDGCLVDVAFEGKIGLDEFGGFKQTHCVFTDITESRRAAQALRASEEKYRQLFDLESDAIFLIERDGGRILEANSGATKLYGYSHDEWLTMRNVDVSVEPQQTTTATQTGVTDIPVRWHRKKDGTIFPVDIRATHFDWQGRPVHLAAIRDITERVRVEQVLRASEERHRTILQTALDGFWLTDTQGRLQEVNEAYCKMSGYGPQELLTMCISDLEAVETVTETAGHFQKIMAQGQDRFETRHRRKDGSIFDVAVSAQYQAADGGRVVVFLQDITERLRAESALRESEERLRDITFSMADWVWEVDENGVYTYSSQKGSDFFGPANEHIIGKTPFDLMPPDEAKRVGAIFSEIAANKAPIKDLENWNIGKNGQRFCLLTNGVPILDAEGNLKGYRGVDKDITGRKQAEEHLRRSEADLRQAQHVAHVGSWRWDIQTGHLVWSDEMYHIFGITKEGFSGSLPDVLAQAIHPADREKVEAANRSVSERGIPVPLEYRIVWPDGSVRVVWAEAGELIRDEAGNPSALTGIAHDITDRKRIEDALRNTNNLLQRTLAGLDQVVLVLNVESRRIITCNPAVERVFGYLPEEVVGQTTRVLHVSQESYDAFLPKRKSLTGPDGLAHLEYQLRRRDGTIFWSEVTVAELKGDTDNPALVVTMVRDITERMRAQEALRAERDRAEAYLQIAGVVLLALDTEGKITLINRKGCELLGFTEDELIGKDWFDTCLPPADHEAMRAILSRSFAGEDAQLAEFENPVVTRSGETRLISWRNSILRDAEGRPLGILSSGEDITERNRAVEELKRRNEFVENLLERAPIGFAVNTIHDGMRVYVSSNFESIYGVEPGSIQSVSDYFEKVYLDPVFREQIRERIMADMATGEAARMRWEDIPITTATGEHKVVTAINIPLLDQNLMISTVQDVTERKRVEEALRQTERDLVNAQKLAGIGSWTYDPVAQQPKWSDGMFLIWGLDPKLGAPNYAEHTKLIHPEDFQRFDDAVQESVQHGIPYRLDLRICRPDGTLRTITTICEPQVDATGNVVSLRGTAQDITERKQSEDLVRASLREKEILLREIHHRVKNNLQVIASLLTLQTQSVNDPVALEVLQDSQNRIRAMSLIHAKLYESTDLARVDFGAFVRDLGTILVRAYAVDRSAIHLQVSAGQTDLEIDTLVPCSLIVNELLSNAIKHAFQPGSDGTITVGLSKVDGGFLLRVADDGAGFPTTIDFRNTKSLGLRLVNMLVEQLDGTIELHGEGGTEFIIRFPGAPTA